MELILGSVVMTVRNSLFRELEITPSPEALAEMKFLAAGLEVKPMGSVVSSRSGSSHVGSKPTAEITPPFNGLLPHAFARGDLVNVHQVVLEPTGDWFVTKMSWTEDMLLPRVRGFGTLVIPHSEIDPKDPKRKWKKGFISTPQFGPIDATVYRPAAMGLKNGSRTGKMLLYTAVRQVDNKAHPYLVVQLFDLPEFEEAETEDPDCPTCYDDLRHPPIDWPVAKAAKALALYHRTLLRHEHTKQICDTEDQRLQTPLYWANYKVPMCAVFKYNAFDENIKFRPKLHDPVLVHAVPDPPGSNVQFGGKAVVVDNMVIPNESAVQVTIRFTEIHSIDILARGICRLKTLNFEIKPGFESDAPRLFEQFFKNKLPTVLGFSEENRTKKIFNILLGRFEDLGYEKLDKIETKLLSKIPGFEDLEWNSDQERVAHAYLKQKRPVTVFQGPPGTGKTVLLSSMAYLRHKEHRDAVLMGLISQEEQAPMLLISAPSNRAADRIAELLYKIQQEEPEVLSILRIYSSCREVDGTPCAPFSLHELAVSDWNAQNEDAKPHLERYNELMGRLTSFEWENKTRHQTNIQSKEASAMAKVLRQLRKELQEIVLANGHFNTVITTMAASQDKRLEGEYFTDILLDETGQSTIPEALLAVSKLHNESGARVVITGDEHQLKSVVTSSGEAADLLSTSFMSQIPHIGCVECLALGVSYRMHPAILKHPSEHTYGGALVSGVTAEQRSELIGKFPWPVQQEPILFCHVKGPDHRPAGYSRVNFREIEGGTAFVTFLREYCNVAPERIGMSTFYDLHRSKQTLRLVDQKVPALTVDSNQGAEYAVSVLACVRSARNLEALRLKLEQDPEAIYEGLGFLVDSGRRNVALTRAQHGLIVIGDAETLALDRKGWGPFIDFCYEHGYIVEDFDQMLPTFAAVDPADWYNEQGYLRPELMVRSPNFVPEMEECHTPMEVTEAADLMDVSAKTPDTQDRFQL